MYPVKKLKRGDVREDGKIFWVYAKRYKNGECWVKPETFKKIQPNQLRHSKAQRMRLKGNPEHMAKMVVWQTNYRNRNRPKVRAYMRSYSKKRRDSDPNYRLACIMRSRIRLAIQDGNKSAPTLELIGGTVDFIRQYLENRFQPGMSWDNWGHGESCWQIDHIRPCASFDLTDPAQQKACFHFTNMQPLWARDNYVKSDNWEGPKTINE